MPGFPLLWEEEKLGPVSDDGCPVTEGTIATYLVNCSCHYLRDFDPPLEFGRLALVLRKSADNRDYWIFTCRDGIDRPWFVVASSGRADSTRWVFAESNEDGLSADGFLEITLAEMQLGSGRPN